MDSRESARQTRTPFAHPHGELDTEAARRQAILQAANAAFARLRADPDAWREELEERRAWDVTLVDRSDDA